MRLSVKDAAILLGVSGKTVYRWIAQGKIPVHRVGDQYRFVQTELFEWAVKHQIPASSELLAESGSDDPDATLLDCLRRGGISYRIHGETREDAIRNALGEIRGIDEGSLEQVISMIVAREQISPTAVGDGIAIPHPRSPLGMHVLYPLLYLAFLEKPVDYGALDGKPVQALFFLVCPTLRTHLRLLGRLAFVLRDPNFKSVIRNEKTRDEIVSAIAAAEVALKPGG